ncbi:MAG: caspase family protein [Ideonella sp.]|nr:caspase family protein [Ideonella sp.]
MAALAAERELAQREAAARRAAAELAAAEAAAREAAILERKSLAIVKALEVPPALTAPQAKRIQVAAAEVTLPFAIRSAGNPAGVLLEVRVNGRPAQPSELVLPRNFDGNARGFARLPLAEGESLVEILARNAYGVSEPLSFKVARTGEAVAAASPRGDLYVLAIGISNYLRPDYRLGLAAKDARDFADTLRQQQGRQYRKVHARVLTDREASRAAIQREFQWLQQVVGPGDVAMLFMAGHGLNDTLGQYYFLPADGQHERLATTALPQGTIVSTLSKVRGKTLLFLDTCFAGSSLGALSKAGRQTEKMMNELSASENGVVVFASSTGQEESEEKAEWGNGAFTKVLIEGLEGKADFTGRGRVTSAGLNLFLSEGVSRLTHGRQRPVFISPRGVPDFALVQL